MVKRQDYTINLEPDAIIIFFIQLFIFTFTGLIYTTMINSARKIFWNTIKSDSLSEPLLSRTTNNVSSSDPSLRFFSHKELKAATRNFHNNTLLRKDRLVTVYRGSILDVPDSQRGRSIIVIIKKFDHQGKLGFSEWQSEVKKIGGICHPNLERLMGYGWNDQELFLVSEFMEQGSLDNHLFLSSPHSLAWDIRVKIMIGAARGLAFLHSSGIKVIYRDFKSSYILLDQFYHVRLSDYGPHAKNALRVESGDNVSYHFHLGVDPQYAVTGCFTAKSDVYSFGVVLMEMLTGFRVVDSKDPKYITAIWKEETKKELVKMIDPRMEGRYCCESAAEIAQLAFNCLQSDRKRRPTMEEVVQTLEILDNMPNV